MAVLFSDPFGTFLQFQQALDALRASSWLEPSVSGGGAFPPLNVFRKGDDVVIITELPGIRKADLQIQVRAHLQPDLHLDAAHRLFLKARGLSLHKIRAGI